MLGKKKPAAAATAAQGANRDRLAPRSAFQFKLGPPFSETTVLCAIATLKGVPVVPAISARVDRGFDFHHGQWIGYKRNYFALVASFSFANLPLQICAGESFYLTVPHGATVPLTSFRIRLSDINLSDPDAGPSLVQHTSKRDRGPQFDPPTYTAVPGELPLHDFMKLISNIRKNSRVEECYNLFFLNPREKALLQSNPSSIISTYPPHDEIAKVAKYERIQFLGAKNKGKCSSMSKLNSLFRLVVELLATADDANTYVLAYAQSPPLVIRGRSPANYASSPPTPEPVPPSGFDYGAHGLRSNDPDGPESKQSPLKNITNNVAFSKKNPHLDPSLPTSHEKPELKRQKQPRAKRSPKQRSTRKLPRHYFVKLKYHSQSKNVFEKLHDAFAEEELQQNLPGGTGSPFTNVRADSLASQRHGSIEDDVINILGQHEKLELGKDSVDRSPGLNESPAFKDPGLGESPAFRGCELEETEFRDHRFRGPDFDMMSRFLPSSEGLPDVFRTPEHNAAIEFPNMLPESLLGSTEDPGWDTTSDIFDSLMMMYDICEHGMRKPFFDEEDDDGSGEEMSTSRIEELTKKAMLDPPELFDDDIDSSFVRFRQEIDTLKLEVQRGNLRCSSSCGKNNDDKIVQSWLI